MVYYLLSKEAVGFLESTLGQECLENHGIFEILRLINSMRDDYKFYLRTNGNQWGPSEMVFSL